LDINSLGLNAGAFLRVQHYVNCIPAHEAVPTCQDSELPCPLRVRNRPHRCGLLVRFFHVPTSAASPFLSPLVDRCLQLCFTRPTSEVVPAAILRPSRASGRPRKERGLLRMRSEDLISTVPCDWFHGIDPLVSVRPTASLQAAILRRRVASSMAGVKRRSNAQRAAKASGSG
jgi:hypothetical protein